ncbi:MAG: hypothetical protein ABI039_09855 [Vicinamibacterales bacterium]
MVVLRCTQRLLVRLKQVDALPTIESTTRLGDWYGNTLQLGRRRVMIFISERSRLPILIPIRDANRLPAVFPEAVCEMLEVVGIPAADIAEECLRMSSVSFGRTRSRSLLGTLNDFSFLTGASPSLPVKEPSLEEIARFLARTPIMPLGGARPIDLTRGIFENQ